jgi:hypothetical protein
MSLVPTETLMLSMNRLQFTAANGGPIARPLAVKAVKWQLKYPTVNMEMVNGSGTRRHEPL